MRTGSLILGAVTGAGIVLVIAGAAWWSLFGPEIFPSGRAPGMLGDSGLVMTPREQAGEAIYNTSCVGCHGGPEGGGMNDYPPRHNANGHTWHHPDCQLARIILTGGDEMTESMRGMMASPGASPMPAFAGQLSEEEVEAVLSYIRLMWTPEQRSVQAQITREICTAVR